MYWYQWFLMNLKDKKDSTLHCFPIFCTISLWESKLTKDISEDTPDTNQIMRKNIDLYQK
jgi:hypothetical protein